MPGALTFTILGRPVTKGSRIPGQRKDGSLYTRDVSPKARAWANVAAAALVARRDTIGHPGFQDQPTVVQLTFNYERPAKPAHQHPSRQDIDKAARAVLDALVNGGVIGDDRHVVDLRARKRYCDGDEERISGMVRVANPAELR